MAKHGCKGIDMVVLLDDTISTISSSFTKSSNRNNELKAVQDEFEIVNRRIVKLCKPRWYARTNSCITILHSYRALVKVFDGVLEKATKQELQRTGFFP